MTVTLLWTSFIHSHTTKPQKFNYLDAFTQIPWLVPALMGAGSPRVCQWWSAEWPDGLKDVLQKQYFFLVEMGLLQVLILLDQLPIDALLFYLGNKITKINISCIRWFKILCCVMTWGPIWRCFKTRNAPSLSTVDPTLVSNIIGPASC